VAPAERYQHDRSTPGRVVVVTGAAPLEPVAVARLGDADFIVAADGGLDHALAAGLRPHLLVGDLDSVSAAARDWAAGHAETAVHPTDKSRTDTELAIAVATDRRPERLTLLAGAGDRLDHTIAAVGALGGPSTEAIATVDGWWGAQRLLVVRPGRPVGFMSPPGTTFSVLALHGPCRGVTIAGARWPLTGADLDPVVGVGVSNQTAGGEVIVEVAAGVLTVIVQPDPALGTTSTSTPTTSTEVSA
jgi:thiamine pyrophosphokinase